MRIETTSWPRLLAIYRRRARLAAVRAEADQWAAVTEIALARSRFGRRRLVCFDMGKEEPAEVTNEEVRRLYADPAKREELFTVLMRFVRQRVGWLFRGSHQLEDLKSVGYEKVYDCLTKAMAKDNPLGYLDRAVERACIAYKEKDYWQINRAENIGKVKASGTYTSYVEDSRRERRGSGCGEQARERDHEGGDQWDYISLHAIRRPDSEPGTAEEMDKILQVAAGVFDNTASNATVEQNLQIIDMKMSDLNMTWAKIGREFDLPQQTIANRVADYKKRLLAFCYKPPPTSDFKKSKKS